MQAIQTLRDESVSKHHVGEAAEREFRLALECAFAEFATGGVFGYRWEARGTEPGNPVIAPTLTLIERPQDLVLTDFNMVVIDSGSLSGDSWKYVYHPALQCGTFIQEA